MIGILSQVFNCPVCGTYPCVCDKSINSIVQRTSHERQMILNEVNDRLTKIHEFIPPFK